MSNKFDRPYRYINSLDSNKISELFSLINNMDSQILKQFSLIHKIPLSTRDPNGDTLIHKILQSDDSTKNEILRLNIIKFLIQEGVNPDSPNSDNVTSLHLSCGKQYIQITKYLIIQIIQRLI